jgi:hypothetical protein
MASASLVVLAGCAAAGTARTERTSEHYSLQADRADDAFLALAASDCERVHAVLARAYGAAPRDRYTVRVDRTRAVFDGALGDTAKGHGIVGECQKEFAIVYWPDRERGEDRLAHELVHHFDAELLPELPFWQDEGLAKALAPRREAQDTVTTLAALPDDELRALVRSLPSLPAGEDYPLRCLVAAAVVRFALDTQRLETVRELRGFEPDPDRFLRWLRRPRPPSPARFAPVWSQAGEGASPP